MADDSEITGLPVATTVIPTDILPFVGDNATVPETKQITIDNFITAISASIVSGSTAYAPADEGVTNGNSHDHIGGDGASIAEGAFSFADNTTGNATSTKHGLALKVGSTGRKLVSDGTNQVYTDDDSGLNVIIGDGTNTITTGVKGFVEIPVNCTLESIRLVADASGSVVIDVWKDTYANFPPTDADSITSSTPPTLAGAIKAENTSLTSWTTSFTKGDWLAFNVDSATTVKQVTLSLNVRITATS